MANYKLLSVGVDDKEAVKKLQQSLNDTQKSNLDVDGIYGEKTRDAVKAYQTANNLAVDGIAGDETLGHLYGTAAQTTTTTTPAAATPTALQTHQSQQPGPFTWDKQADANQAWQNYRNREDFSYDLTADPMYQQYKQQYMNLGKLAMLDTMGQAAAMTGGYGNSYAQTAGQQAYQGYLQQLNEVAPELYGQAYNRWQAEGEALYNEALAYETLRQQAYNEHQDTLSRWYTERDYLTTQQNTNYSNLMNLLATGYDPTDEELKNAGMTRAQAKAIQSYYTPKNTTYSADSNTTISTNGVIDNGTRKTGEIIAMQRELGVTADGLWGQESRAAAKARWGTEDADSAWKANNQQLQEQYNTAHGTLKRGIAAYDESSHNAIAEDNGGSYYQQILNDLKIMKSENRSDAEAYGYLQGVVGYSFITPSEYMTLYNKYRDNRL